MTDSADKPSLEDIAKADPSTSKTEDAAMFDAAEVSGEESSGSNIAVWLVVVLVVLGGATVAGWSYISPYVEPTVSDLRAMMGLTPRPTEPRLPSEQHAEVAAQPVVPDQTTSQAVQSETSQSEPVQAEPVLAESTQAEPAQPETTPATEVGVTEAPDALAARIEAMQGELDALGKMFGPESQANLNAIGGVVRALEDVNRELVSLSDRLQVVEERTQADPTAPAQALVLGVTQLRARLTGDAPFAAELVALEQIAAGDPAVAAAVAHLRPHADVGIPSEAVLTARFDKVAKAIVAARSTSEAEGWLGAVKDSLGGLVTVRRTDPTQITDANERAVAVAEAALELGELSEAVKALSELQGAPAEAAAAWMGDASARVNAEAALEELHRHALAVLSAAGGAQKGN